MIKTTLITFILLSFCSLFSAAQENKSAKLIGGMYINSTYFNNINSFGYGLGGKISYRINNFRIGSEGYSTKSSFNDNDSFYYIGWGGILIEYLYHFKKSNLVIGSSFGGGSNKQMEIIHKGENYSSYSIVKWQKESSFIISPFVGYEHALSSKANISVKADYLFSPTNDIFNKGIRLYVGFLFNMIK